MNYDLFHSSIKIQKKLIKKKNFTYRFLLSILDKLITKSSVVLDIGCGVGTVDLYLARKVKKIIGTDVSGKSILTAERNANLLGLSEKVSFSRANFPSDDIQGEYDLIICSEVLEHLRNDKLVISEIYRLMKNDGIVIISVPLSTAPLFKLGVLHTFDKRVGHLRRYQPTEFVNLFATAGFKVVKSGVTEGIIRSFMFTNNYAEKLIRKGSAYVCNCSAESFKELATKKKECPCRKKTVQKNSEDWEKMLNKKNGFGEGEAVLRFKTPKEEKGMENPNPAMRDFPLARINLHEHPKQKKKYRVWPLMNLSVSVDDIELEMTHVIRGKDHKDNAQRQKMIYKVLGMEKKFPWTFFIGRIKFSDLELSKRKIVEAVKEGKYSGWDDPKLATVSAIKKRGYKKEAIEKFIEQRGLTESDKVISSKDLFEVLDKFNK